MTYTCRSGTHKWEKYHNHTGPPQGARDVCPTSGSQSRVLHREDEPPECVTLKTRGSYVQESWRAIGNRDSALKGCTQNLICSET